MSPKAEWSWMCNTYLKWSYSEILAMWGSETPAAVGLLRCSELTSWLRVWLFFWSGYFRASALISQMLWTYKKLRDKRGLTETKMAVITVTSYAINNFWHGICWKHSNACFTRESPNFNWTLSFSDFSLSLFISGSKQARSTVTCLSIMSSSPSNLTMRSPTR